MLANEKDERKTWGNYPIFFSHISIHSHLRLEKCSEVNAKDMVNKGSRFTYTVFCEVIIFN